MPDTWPEQNRRKLNGRTVFTGADSMSFLGQSGEIVIMLLSEPEPSTELAKTDCPSGFHGSQLDVTFRGERRNYDQQILCLSVGWCTVCVARDYKINCDEKKIKD